MNRLLRTFRHLMSRLLFWREPVPGAVLAGIEEEIAQGELRHTAEIRIVIERALSPLTILQRGISPRERALEVFAELHVWDTAANNGVLVYVSVADHQVEILADRAASASVDSGVWEDACAQISRAAAEGRLGDGILAAVRDMNGALAAAFPGAGANPNELRDRPLVR